MISGIYFKVTCTFCCCFLLGGVLVFFWFCLFVPVNDNSGAFHLLHRLIGGNVPIKISERENQ